MNLYDIEAGLSEALTVWQEAMETDALESQAGEQTQAERILAADLALRTYAELELRKVDGYIATMRTLTAALAYRKAEAARHRKAAEGIQNALDWLKQYAQTAMEVWGKKRLEGKTGYLLLKGNGGKQPVTITDGSLVPDEFCTVTATIPMDLWSEVVLALDGEDLSRVRTGPRVPSLSLIGEALERGDGVPGARLENRGQHVEVK